MTKQTITSKDILKLAALSKLSISEAEIETYTQQLNAILDYVSQLETVDTENIEPLLQVLDQENVSRPDIPKPSIERENALKNAPDEDGKFFHVPEVIKK